MKALLKQTFDVIGAAICLILLCLVGSILAILIYWETPGPIFFIQTRAGKDEKPFRMYKFRSMAVNNIAPMELGPVKHKHNLVTRTGYIMRRTKLDEIPQFLNVLRGEMSFVGPRPCLIEKIDALTPNEKRRFSVLPGMTGWAEVNGNVELSWEEQLMLDVWYIDHRSLWLDLQILFKTLGVVVFGSERNEKAIEAAKIYQNTMTQQYQRV